MQHSSSSITIQLGLNQILKRFYGILCFHKWNIYDCMNEFKCMNFKYSVHEIVTAHNAQTSINLNIDEYVRIVIISFFPARD